MNINDKQRKEIGYRIQLIRKGLGLTMKEFGEKFSPPASDSIVSRWERGVSLPNNERLKRIADLGNITTAYLLSGHPFDNMTPVEREEHERNEYEQQMIEGFIEQFKDKKYVQIEDFLDGYYDRYIYINGHKLEKDEIEMLIKLFEGKEKNYPADEEIEKEYYQLREQKEEFEKKKAEGKVFLSMAEFTNYKFH